jgi:hypothetical protein
MPYTLSASGNTPSCSTIRMGVAEVLPAIDQFEVAISFHGPLS